MDLVFHLSRFMCVVSIPSVSCLLYLKQILVCMWEGRGWGEEGGACSFSLLFDIINSSVNLIFVNHKFCTLFLTLISNPIQLLDIAMSVNVAFGTSGSLQDFRMIHDLPNKVNNYNKVI